MLTQLTRTAALIPDQVIVSEECEATFQIQLLIDIVSGPSELFRSFPGHGSALLLSVAHLQAARVGSRRADVFV